MFRDVKSCDLLKITSVFFLTSYSFSVHASAQSIKEIGSMYESLFQRSGYEVEFRDGAMSSDRNDFPNADAKVRSESVGKANTAPSPTIYKAKVFGADERMPIAKSEYDKFSGIGAIECKSPSGGFVGFTGSIAGNFKTVVTVAHAFYLNNTRYTKDQCVFALHYLDGSLREVLKISQIQSRWSDDNAYEDPNSDVALVQLESPSKTAASGIAIQTNAKGFKEIMIVGFGNDHYPNTQLQKAYGSVYSKPKGNSLASAKHVIIYDVDTAGANSGSPIFDSLTGNVIGIHEGADQPSGHEGDSVFRPDNNFNRGFLFDDRFYSELMEFTK